MLRKVLIAAAIAGLSTAALASAAVRTHRGSKQLSVTTEELMPGVTYTRQVEFTRAGPVVLDVVTAPRPDGTLYSLAPELAHDSLPARDTLTGIEQRFGAGATTVGIDGDYFNRRTGVPSGILMRGGVLDSAPAPGRSSLGIAADGTLDVGRVSFTGSWRGSGQPRPLVLNPGGFGFKFALYTPAFGAQTPRASHVGEAVLSSFPPTRPGQPLDGVVTEVLHHGGIPIPRGGAVLVGRGARAAQLESEARTGAQVEVRLMLSPDWSSLASAIGGGPLLVEDGRPVFSAGEGFDASTVNSHEARGAIGQLADGRIVLVTVEGTSPAYSVGMSSFELAVELARLGATTAIGLGSGAPAGMAFDGKLLTRPTGGRQQRISDALVLSYSGVYAAPPSTDVLSPNGDGVGDTETFAYRLARLSTVSATLAGPGGSRVALASGSSTAGLHQLSWDGTIDGARAPEGEWTLTVRATDDRGIETTAQRTFALDDTLASLQLARASRGRVVASFDLARAASVVVRVERRNGVAVATILRRSSLQPGTIQATWNGRIGGRVAPRGRYQVDVQATSSVGTSSLVAPFSWTPHARK